MPVIVIRDPLSGISFPGVESYRMYLYAETGKTSFSVPIAPREISYGGIGQEWVTAERSGSTPLLLRKGIKLKTIAFSTLITDVTSMWSPQTDAIIALEQLANSPDRIMVRYGPQEAGLWRITECSYDSALRHHESNEVTRATLAMTLTRASDAAPAVGPVSGGVGRPPTPAPPAPPRTHRVVPGNTLWGIALKYYGSGPAWPRIYDANRGQIRDPHWIYPNQVFVIP
jgi:LysM domain